MAFIRLCSAGVSTSRRPTIERFSGARFRSPGSPELWLCPETSASTSGARRGVDAVAAGGGHDSAADFRKTFPGSTDRSCALTSPAMRRSTRRNVSPATRQ